MISPTTVISIRRYARPIWGWVIGGNLAVIGAAVGVNALLSSPAIPVPARAGAAVGAGVLALVLVVSLLRRGRDGLVGRLEWGPQTLTAVLGRGRPRTCALAEVRARRLAYLTHEGGVGHEHVPVLELRLGDQTLQIAGRGARAWPHPEGTLYSVPRHAVDAADWSALIAILGAR